MPTPIDILTPCAIAFAVLLLARRPWARSRMMDRWGPPIAVVAFLFRINSINGAWPTFPPSATLGWLVYIALAAALIGVAMNYFQLPRALNILIVALAIAAATCAMLSRALRADSRGDALITITLLSIGGAGWFWAFAHRERRFQTPLAMLVLIGFTAILSVASSSMLYGRIGFALAGVTAAFLLIAFFNYSPVTMGALFVFVICVAMLLAAGRTFAEMNFETLACVTTAPILFGVSESVISPSRRKLAICIAWISLLAPLCYATSRILPAYIRESNQSGYGE